jgi:hypothetical protein
MGLRAQIDMEVGNSESTVNLYDRIAVYNSY